MTCGMGCPDSLICRDHGCQWEADQYAQQQYFEQQERAYAEAMEADYLRAFWKEAEFHVYIWRPGSGTHRGFNPHLLELAS